MTVPKIRTDDLQKEKAKYFLPFEGNVDSQWIKIHRWKGGKARSFLPLSVRTWEGRREGFLGAGVGVFNRKSSCLTHTLSLSLSLPLPAHTY